MKRIILPLFNDYYNPTVLFGFLVCEEDDPNQVVGFRVGDALHTPYYRFPLFSGDPLALMGNSDTVVVYKKALYKYIYESTQTPKDVPVDLSHDFDVLLNLWCPTYEPPSHPDTTVYHVQRWSDKIRRSAQEIFSMYQDLNSPYTQAQSLVLRACALLDGTLTLLEGDRVLETKYKWFDPLSKTFRLRDVGSSSISLPKEERDKFLTKDFVFHLDFDGFHLRIMDNLLGIHEIDFGRKAMDVLFEGQSKVRNREEFKTSVYKAIYSGYFGGVDHPWMETVHQTMDKMKSPLGINPVKTPDKNSFNTKIQQWEVYILSMLVCAIDTAFREAGAEYAFHQYLYDGLYMSCDTSEVEVLTSVLSKFPLSKFLGETKKGEPYRFPLSVDVLSRVGNSNYSSSFRTSG